MAVGLALARLAPGIADHAGAAARMLGQVIVPAVQVAVDPCRRELEQCILRALVLAQGEKIDLVHLPDAVKTQRPPTRKCARVRRDMWK